MSGDEFAQRRVNSYVALLTTDRLAELVVEASGVELSPGQVRSMIDASGDLDTVLLRATVTSTSRDLALTLAEAVSTQFVELVSVVENGGEEGGSVLLEVVSGPSVRPVPTRPMLSIALRGLFGTLLGLGLAVLLHLRDHTVRSEEDLGSLGLEPVLGSIPLDRRERFIPLYVEDRMGTATAEAFRHLRTNLQFLDVDSSVHVLVVSSSVPEEGKSFVSRSLALTIAAANLRVLLIEADLRRPTLAEDFEVERVPGLSDVLAGRADLEEALRPWRSSDLTILPSGYLPPNPSELLGSGAARRLIGKLRDRFDVVVIDTPPLLPVTDGAVLATLADGVILVVREGKTSRHQLALSAQRLQLVGARLLGTVMNMTEGPISGGYSTYDQEPGLAAADKEPGLAAADKEPGRAATDKEPESNGRDPLAEAPGRPPRVGDPYSGRYEPAESERASRRDVEPAPGSVAVPESLPFDHDRDAER